jgi:hypothetical protein
MITDLIGPNVITISHLVLFEKTPLADHYNSVSDDEPKKIKITIKPAAEKTTASLDEFRSIQLTLPTPPVWVSIM